MSLHIEQRESEGMVVLDLKGPLTLGHGDLEPRDSTGPGTLVFGLARLRKAGGKRALVNLNRSHVELFLLTKLALAFEWFEDEDVRNSDHGACSAVGC